MTTEAGKSCGSQHFHGETPADYWSIEQLGEFAAIEHRAIVTEENSLAPRYWQLGKALNLARKQIRHGRWQSFLQAHATEKTRASKARAIHRTFASEQELDGLSVDDAYARRTRKEGRREIPPVDAAQHLSTQLQALGDLVEQFASNEVWDSHDDAAELLSNVDGALRQLERLQQLLFDRATNS